MIDDLREQPVQTLQAWFGTPGSPAGVPLAVRMMLHLFVTGPERRVMRGAVRRLFGA